MISLFVEGYLIFYFVWSGAGEMPDIGGATELIDLYYFHILDFSILQV